MKKFRTFTSLKANSMTVFSPLNDADEVELEHMVVTNPIGAECDRTTEGAIAVVAHAADDVIAYLSRHGWRHAQEH